MLNMKVLMVAGAWLADGAAVLPAQTSKPVTLQTPTGTLAGTLQVPAGAGAHPLVVFIAGSGSTDRDGNIAPAVRGDVYRQLADSLAARGIATLRYDKRGVAASAGAIGAERDVRFETGASDAAGWVTQARKDRRFSRIVILGHSEGSLLGMLASAQVPVDGFISLAGVARRIDQVVHDQLAPQLPTALLAQSDSVFAALVRGDTVPNAPAALAALFRPSVQPYLISWLRYSGETEIAKLRIPALIVQGTHDVQVALAEADRLAAAQPAAKSVRIAGMNHVLKMAPTAILADQLPIYADAAAKVPGELVVAVATFVSGLKAAK